MKEYIDREKLLKKVKSEYDPIREKYDKESFESQFKRLDLEVVTTLLKAIVMIEEEPVADVVEVVHGSWSWCKEDKYRCTNCGRHTRVDEVMENPVYNFCPYCGAKNLEE